jgi:hypothetical protein
MGVYNPHIPQVLGQEWVDIRNEDVVFSPSVNVVEIGHTFTPTSNRVLQQGKFYIHDAPPSQVDGQVMLVSVYPSGREALSGPIQSVTIPCNAAGVTGTAFSILVSPSSTAATSANVPPALVNPGDNGYLTVTPSDNTGAKTVALSFATSQYAQLLTNKRIVKVELLHTLGWEPILQGSQISSSIPPLLDQVDSHLTMRRTGIASSTIIGTYSPAVFFYNSGLTFVGGALQISRPPGILVTSVNLGEINPLAGVLTGTSIAKYPWRYEDLALFEASAGANRISMVYEFGATSVSDTDHWAGLFYLGYAALRVSYCEEQRVAYAGVSFGPANTGGSSTASAFVGTDYVLGANALPFVDTHYAINPTLTAGQQYTVTVSAPDIGDLNGPLSTINVSKPAASNAYPNLNALRELETDPVHVGLKINLTQTEGETFTREVTHVLPQLSLHTSGGPLTEVHVYGRQAVAQVYGSITATQNILDGGVGSAKNFTQVRYYARRFGNTTVNLNLSGPGGVSTDLTPGAWDALDEIIDGWKEVTLTLNTPASMGTGTNPTFTWAASGELAGNRWEVLGATAPALSGTPGSLLTLAPNGALSSATYGQPVSGAIIELGWIPGYSVPVSGTTLDATSDAVLMFSQDMPTVTGFTVTAANQPLSGIGLDCNAYPWYVPSSMAYNNLAWSATSSSTPVTGFGYYEVQRMDTITTAWQTIAQMTSPAASGFKDYEARVGILSSYRIRAVNSLLFAGSWSSTVTGTLSAPGVTGTGMGANARTLLFTANEVQSGASNLAYALAFESDTTEEFKFPEAAFTQYQFMYNRDFQVAFRPLERGGETFSRTILVQAAAISPPTLADFTSLRNLAWDNLSYVCVRDEDGNRWFANVTVPTGRVKMNNRELYLADINVIEVTDTASVVEV